MKILMYCVEKGYAKNIDIHYNTNGTQLPPQDIFDLWAYFKHVEIAFSIDDIGEPFEYQRHPANWRQVSSNLVKFKEKSRGCVCAAAATFRARHGKALRHLRLHNTLR